MKRFIPILILIFAAAGGYQWYQATNNKPAEAVAETGLFGSGAIEAETIAITAELGGRITGIAVAEGEEVSAGQVLVELDRANLLAQKAQLESAVALAEANLALVSAPPRPEEITLAQTGLAQASTMLDGAYATWQQLELVLADPHELEAQLNQARSRVAQAESNLEQARVNLKRAEINAEAAGRNQSSTLALAKADAAQKQLDAAQIGVQMAEVALQGAMQQVEHLRRLQAEPLPLVAQTDSAQAAYQQTEAAELAAEVNLLAVRAGPNPEDVAIAQAQVAEAKAALHLLEVQLEKQTLTAPRAGLVSKRLVEPGELAAPGKLLLELSDIETVELVVYLPETEIGQVQVGQQARVTVDAYGSETFPGVVSFIAHEAEFTPKNVQTREERVNLMFAVKITLDNADHRLKPGMPADAEILSTLAPVAAERETEVTVEKTTVLPTATPIRSVVPPTATPAPTPTAAPPIQYAEVLAWTLNVRTGPGLAHEPVAHLNQGETVPVVSVDSRTGWLEVELPAGDTGWISGSETFVTLFEK